MSKPEEQSGSSPRSGVKRPRTPEVQETDKKSTSTPVLAPAPATTPYQYAPQPVQYAPWPGYVPVPAQHVDAARQGPYAGSPHSGYSQQQPHEPKIVTAPQSDGQPRPDQVAWHPVYQQPSVEGQAAASQKTPKVEQQQVTYVPPPPQYTTAPWQQVPPVHYGAPAGYAPPHGYAPPAGYPGYPVHPYGPQAHYGPPPNGYAPPGYAPPGYVMAPQAPGPGPGSGPAQTPQGTAVGAPRGYERSNVPVEQRGVYHPQQVYVQDPSHMVAQPPRGVAYGAPVPPFVYSPTPPQTIYRTAQNKEDIAKDAEKIKSLRVERELDNLVSRRPKRRRRPQAAEATNSSTTYPPSTATVTTAVAPPTAVVMPRTSTTSSPPDIPQSVGAGVEGEDKNDLKSKRSRDPGRSSKYRGVSWNKWNTAWKACIKVKEKKKTEHIGYFDDEKDAARAYDIRAIQYRGDKAQLNFPESV